MLHRPVNASGDILPVLSSSGLLKGAAAVARLVRERLELLAGEWWENPEWGNGILDLLQESRLTEADQQTLAGYLTSYIRETPGVDDVRDVSFSDEGRQFSYSCTIETEDGSASINYELLSSRPNL